MLSTHVCSEVEVSLTLELTYEVLSVNPALKGILKNMWVFSQNNCKEVRIAEINFRNIKRPGGCRAFLLASALC